MSSTETNLLFQMNSKYSKYEFQCVAREIKYECREIET